jgi:uncharacterized protein (TIGR02757 family)
VPVAGDLTTRRERETERQARIGATLDHIRATCDVAARLNADPVGLVHRYGAREDQELVGLACACAAFGNVKAIRAKLDDLLARLGDHPARVADDPAALRARLRGWKHRVFRGDDLARLLAGARAVQRADGSLGARFSRELADRGDLRGALAAWCDAIRDAGGLRAHAPKGSARARNSPAHAPKGSARARNSPAHARRRGPAHLLPDPRGPSGCKRLLLYLRWMARPADGVDLGLWDLGPEHLLIPVDVHIHRLGKNLGFTRRRAASWRTAEEITAALRRYDPHDPAGYDFSLCHMGMLQRCPSRRDARRCEGCGVKPVCIHWHAEQSDRVGK